MLKRKMSRWLSMVLAVMMVVAVGGCKQREKITQLSQLEGKEFAVPGGTAAEQLVLTRFPKAKFVYYDTILEACMAVKAGEADAAAYDQPILKNIAAKNNGLMVLPEMITIDQYGFAVQLGNEELKGTIDQVIADLKANGTYDQMVQRWLPEEGKPAAMPDIQLTGDQGVLKFGTAAVTEPFSFVDGQGKIVGFDIELAMYVAQKLGMKLEVVNMSFVAMIPSLTAGQVDMIGSCLTITEDRSKTVLFSEPYYTGGIAALVKK